MSKRKLPKTEERIEFIKEHPNMTPKEIAIHFGVAPCTINQLILMYKLRPKVTSTIQRLPGLFQSKKFIFSIK